MKVKDKIKLAEREGFEPLVHPLLVGPVRGMLSYKVRSKKTSIIRYKLYMK